MPGFLRAVMLVAFACAVASFLFAILRLGEGDESAQWLMAAGGLAVVGFAIEQMELERVRDAAQRTRQRDKDRALENELIAVAWLARRSCEAALRASTTLSARAWARGVGSALATLQEQFLRILTLGAAGSANQRDASTEAFRHFLAAADRINDLGDVEWLRSHDEAEPYAAERVALRSLSDCVQALQTIARREEHEPPAILDAAERLLTPPARFTGVEVGGAFFAWRGPLEDLAVLQQAPMPTGLTNVIMSEMWEPGFRHEQERLDVIAQGWEQVYETDRVTFKRAILNPGGGYQVLFVRAIPRPTRPTEVAVP